MSKGGNIKQNLLKRISRKPVTQNCIILYLIKKQWQDFLVTVILYLMNSKEQRKIYFTAAGYLALVEKEGYRFLCT